MTHEEIEVLLKTTEYNFKGYQLYLRDNGLVACYTYDEYYPKLLKISDLMDLK